MMERFRSGDSLHAPRARPFPTEARHKFSPLEEDFDRIINHKRLYFSCDAGLRQEIDQLAWLDVMDANPIHRRKFLKQGLVGQRFEFHFLREWIEIFDQRGTRPPLPGRFLKPGVEQTAETELDFWLREVRRMTCEANDLRRRRDAWSIAKWTTFGVRSGIACEITEECARERASRIMTAIAEDDLELYLHTFPMEDSTVYCVV